MNAINETGKKKDASPAGGKDPARELAKKMKSKEPTTTSAGKGKDLAKEVALKGGQDGFSTGK